MVLPFCVSSQNATENVKLLEAFNAQGDLLLKKSRTLFTAVVNDPRATEEERCKALRELGIQDWKFYKDYDGAIKRLLTADQIGFYKSETWLKIHQVEEASGHYEKALEAAKKAISLSEAVSDRTLAQYRYCHTILKQALYQINTNRPYDLKLLSEGSFLLQEILQINPGHVNASEILLGISLLRADGETALKSWLAYFRFSNPTDAYEYLRNPTITLNRILSKWENTTLLKSEKIELIQALGASRFYLFAKMLTKVFEENNASLFKNNAIIKDIAIYASYIEEVKKQTDEYYRKSAINEDSLEDYMSSMASINKDLYNKLKDTKIGYETYNLQNFRNLLETKFGTIYLMGRTSSSSIRGLIMGQTVNQRTRTIEQYGHTSDFSFTELDMITSNGYPSWFWEDRGAGGFAIPGGFIRVKTMFKHLGISAWELITDPIKRAKIEKRIERNVMQSTNTSDRHSILTGLTSKLELDGLDAIYKELVQDGYHDLALQLKFIERYDLYRDNATMFAHEGRHSLDKHLLKDAYYQLNVAEVEYRARLSQIAFSEAPKLELANMIDVTGETGSARANAMIIEVIENWIKANTEKIKGFDHTKLPISQLYLLTDLQIRTIYRQVDPLYIAAR